jgi:hypothetical protein
VKDLFESLLKFKIGYNNQSVTFHP